MAKTPAGSIPSPGPRPVRPIELAVSKRGANDVEVHEFVIEIEAFSVKMESGLVGPDLYRSPPLAPLGRNLVPSLGLGWKYFVRFLDFVGRGKSFSRSHFECC